jgi:hypothetical protein
MRAATAVLDVAGVVTDGWNSKQLSKQTGCVRPSAMAIEPRGLTDNDSDGTCMSYAAFSD